jgi:hypothetical protein
LERDERTAAAIIGSIRHDRDGLTELAVKVRIKEICANAAATRLPQKAGKALPKVRPRIVIKSQR